MSAVIKSGSPVAQAQVKPWPPVAVPQVSKRDEEFELLKRRIAKLEQDLRQRDDAIQRARREIEESFAEGRKKGRDEGLSEAETRETERLQMLERGLERAKGEFASSLSALERLAPLVARECLDIMLAEPDYKTEVLTALIAAQLASVEKSALLRILVASADFPDKKALAGIAKRVGLPATAIVTSADMAAGNCLMRLKLGNQEIGINQQWGVLRDVLGELSLPGSAP